MYRTIDYVRVFSISEKIFIRFTQDAKLHHAHVESHSGIELSIIQNIPEKLRRIRVVGCRHRPTISDTYGYRVNPLAERIIINWSEESRVIFENIVKISCRIRTYSRKSAQGVLTKRELSSFLTSVPWICSTTIRSAAFVRCVEAPGCEWVEKRAKVVDVHVPWRRSVHLANEAGARVMRQSERQTAKSFANVWFVNYYSYPERD